MSKKNRSIVVAIVCVVILLSAFYANSKSSLVRELRGPAAGVLDVFTSGDKLVVVSRANEIYTWDWNDLKKWPIVAKLNTEILCQMEGDKIIHVPNDQPDIIAVSDLRCQKQIKSIPLPFGVGCKMIVPSDDGSYVAALLTYDNKNKLAFIGPELELSEMFSGIDDGVNVFQIGISNDGRNIAACGTKEGYACVIVVKTESGDSWFKSSASHNKDFKRYDRLAFSPDGKKLFVSEKIRFTQMYDIESANLEKTFEIPIYKTPSNQKQNNSAVKVSPNSKILAVDTEPAKKIFFWEIESGSEIGTIIAFDKTVSDIAFSPDVTMIAAGCLVKPTIKIFKTPLLEKQSQN